MVQGKKPRKKVLIVEKSSKFQSIFNQMIGAFYLVDYALASNMVAGKLRVRDIHYDAVILQVVEGGGVHGFSYFSRIAQEIRESSPNTKIIIVSGEKESRSLTNGGCCDKACPKSNLLKTIKELFEETRKKRPSG
jgi:hypothetical protein